MVHIPYLYAHAREIFGKILGHFFGEGGNKHPFLSLHPLVYFRNEIVDLPVGGLDGYLGIEQTGRTDYLLGHLRGAFPFKGTGGGADKNGLIYMVVKFVEIQRAVVEGRRQTKAVVHKVFLSCPVPAVHSPDLGKGDMGFVHKKQIILWKIIEQRKGTASPRTAGHNAGIVFDSLTHAYFLEHFHIVFGALAYSLRFQQLALLLKPPDPLLHFVFYIANGSVHAFPVDNIVGGGIYCGMG